MADGPARVVTNCDDAGPGSLRDTLADASNGDTLDLNQLTCSTITLTSGELATSLDDVTLTGVATISAREAGRVLTHYGSGLLTIQGLVLADGAVAGVNPAMGGCLYSAGSVYLRDATVKGCSAESIPGLTSSALGGGVFSRGDTTFVRSRIRDNSTAAGPSSYGYSRGGGIYVGGNLNSSQSTISANTALGSSVYTQGGGFDVRGQVEIEYSTVSGNAAYFAAAGAFGQSGASSIVNTTISGNRSQFRTGGIASADSLVSIRNSTIAFNMADGPSGGDASGAAVLMLGENPYLGLQSSIIANNARGGIEDDICMNRLGWTVVGSANLILSANVPLPIDTLQVDPMLAPLADNGGATFTHALLSGSPAIDSGENPQNYSYDQRGPGFARVSGRSSDIGAFEVQQPPLPEVIFTDGFD